MTQVNYSGIGMPNPEAHITRSKSKSRGRLKIYNSDTVYLENGEEFEIELFNPTQKTILAKIEFNGEMISHSGLVLKPAQRIFLERFIDSNRKFKFEIYEIENTQKTKAKAGIAKVNAEAKIAEAHAREKMNEFLKGDALKQNIEEIEKLKEGAKELGDMESELNHRANQVEHATRHNGELKIYFYKEKEVLLQRPTIWETGQWKRGLFELGNGTGSIPIGGQQIDVFYNGNFTNINTSSGFDSGQTFTNGTTTTSSVSFDSLGLDSESESEDDNKQNLANAFKTFKKRTKTKKTTEEKVEPIEPRDFFRSTSLGDLGGALEKSIDESLEDRVETGRIGQGGKSSQRFETVDLEFEIFTFHSIEYKILPNSEKPVETSDLRQYCSNCGKKLKKTDNFCSSCGEKI